MSITYPNALLYMARMLTLAIPTEPSFPLQGQQRRQTSPLGGLILVFDIISKDVLQNPGLPNPANVNGRSLHFLGS